MPKDVRIIPAQGSIDFSLSQGFITSLIQLTDSGTLSIASTGPIQIGASNTVAIQIVSNNFVGINTAIPSQNLHVQGNLRLTGGLYDSTNSPGTANQLLISTGSGIAWTSVNVTGILTASGGIANRVSKFLDEDTLGNSNITDSGTQIVLGSASSVSGILTSFGYFGPGTNITNLNASNLTSGTVPSSVVSGSYSGITSVGTLTQLITSGFATASGFFGPGTFVTNLNASNLASGTVPSAVVTGTYPGITSVGSLSQLIVTGFSTINNIRISGSLYDSTFSPGTANQLLISTGSGIAWTSITASGIITGIGSVNVIPKFGSAFSLTTSNISDSGTQIVFNTNTNTVGLATFRNISLTTSSLTTSAFMQFVGAYNDPITLNVGLATTGSISFNGSQGQLFTITNNLTTGSIFSVNDVSGIPSIDVNANGNILIAPYGGNIGIGTTNAPDPFRVQTTSRFIGLATFGAVNITRNLYDANSSTGLAGQLLSSVGAGVAWSSAASLGVVTGTGAASQITVWNSNNTITGFSTFVFVNPGVGINTTVPIKSLHIRNNGILIDGSSATDPAGYGPRLIIDSGASSAFVLADFKNNLGSVFYVTGSRVSIGNSSVVTNVFNVNGGDALINTLTIGLGSGQVATNTAVGFQALLGVTTGVQVTAFGYQAGLSNTIGIENTFIGYLAGRTNTSGGANIAVGGIALFANSTGGFNIAVGRGALTANTIGNNNAALGHGALSNNTSGSNNAAFGFLALQNNVTTSGNTGIGRDALRYYANSSNQTAVGFQALQGNGTVALNTGTGNVAVGYQAGLANTSGSNNTFIGELAGTANTSGSNNLFVGYSAGSANLTGSNNVVLGYLNFASNTSGSFNFVAGGMNANTTGSSNSGAGLFSLNSNTTGSDNTAFGSNALRYWTTTSNQTAVGSGALQGNSTVALNTGAQNTAIGYAAGAANTSGVRNVFIGWSAGIANTSGSDNVAVGNQALWGNQTGIQNVAIGSFALNFNILGNYNIAIGQDTLSNFENTSTQVAIGYRALRGNNTRGLNTGFSNVAVGREALGVNTSGSNNTALGAQAGIANTTGNQNTFIGAQSGDGNITGNSNTYLGYLTDGLPAGSYQIAVGDSVTPTASNLGAWGGNTNATRTNLGIGTFTPLGRLHVETLAATNIGVYIAGFPSQTGNLFEIDATTNGPAYFVTTGIGSVGIYTSVPTQPLHVQGNVRITGGILDSNNQIGLAGSVLSSTGSGISWIASAGASGVTGSGSTNRVAKFSGPSSVTDSTITDTGSVVTIGVGMSVSGFSSSFGFYGPGTFITNLNASNLALGTVPSARISGAYSGITSVGTLTQLIATGISTLQNLELDGWLRDVNNSIGSSGQILSSTGSGVAWSNYTSLGIVTGSGSANQVTFWATNDRITGISTFIYNGALGIGTINPRGSLETNNEIYVDNIYFGIGNSFTNTLIGFAVSDGSFLDESVLIGYNVNDGSNSSKGVIIGSDASKGNDFSGFIDNAFSHVIIGTRASSNNTIRPGGGGKVIIGSNTYSYINNINDQDSGNLVVIGTDAYSGTAANLKEDVVRSTIIGPSASQYASHGDSVIIGTFTGFNTDPANLYSSFYNTIIGNDAGVNFNSASYNTIIGRAANSQTAYIVAFSGGYNVLLGDSTQVSNNNYQIAIGANATVSKTNSGAWGGITNLDRVDLGIGTFAAAARLHVQTLSSVNNGILVAGGVGQTASLLEVDATLNGVTYFIVTGIGSVGVNTSIPTQSLDVNGGLRLRERLFDNSNSSGSANQVLISTGSGIAWTTSTSTGIFTGSGTINTVPKFNTANSITNSNITDNGIAVTVASRLNVTGIGSFTADLIVNGLTIGLGSGRNNTNVAMGISALAQNPSNNGSLIAIGDRAMSLTFGSFFGSIAIGAQTLQNNQGSRNIGIGNNALRLTTTGASNVAIGHQSMDQNVTGSANVAVGRGTLQNSTSDSNTAIGDSVMNLTTSDENTAVGTNAANNLISGRANTAFGFSALRYVSRTSNLTAIGYAALAGSATTTLNSGTQNTALGYQAGTANTSGANNVFIGFQAGLANTSGSRNVFVGRSSGVFISSGSDNTFIGDATNGVPGASYQIGVGASVIPTASNFGAWGGNTNATRTDLGVGTFSPQARIHVETLAAGNRGLYIAGAASQTSNLIEVDATTNGSPLFLVTGIGSVGINTGHAPRYLYVQGDTRLNGPVGIVGDPVAGYPLTVNGNIYLPQGSVLSWSAGNADIQSGSGSAWDMRFRTFSGITARENMRIMSNGNVGIGTTGPFARLHVQGIAATNTLLILSGFGTPTVDLFRIERSLNGTRYITVDSAGELGIGTSTPTQALHVQLNSRFNGAIFDVNNSPGAPIGIVSQALFSTGTGVTWSPVKRNLVVPLMTAFNPTQVGIDSAIFIVPQDPINGTSSMTFNFRRVNVRVETPSAAGITTINIAKSTGTGQFVGTSILSANINLTGAATYEASGTSFAVGYTTASSGDKLAINFVGVNTFHQNLTVELIAIEA